MVFSNKVYINKDSLFPTPSSSSKKYVSIKGVILCYDLSKEIPSGQLGTSTKLR